MSTKLKTLLALLAAGLVGYARSPDPTLFSVSTHVAGWIGGVGIFLLIVAPFDSPPDEESEGKA